MTLAVVLFLLLITHSKTAVFGKNRLTNLYLWLIMFLITCVAVEDLGMDSETDELLSEYGMRYTYDDVSRTLKLYVSR